MTTRFPICIYRSFGIMTWVTPFHHRYYIRKITYHLQCINFIFPTTNRHIDHLGFDSGESLQ